MWISSSGRCSHRGVDVDAVVVVTKVVDVVPPDDVVVVERASSRSRRPRRGRRSNPRSRARSCRTPVEARSRSRGWLVEVDGRHVLGLGHVAPVLAIDYSHSTLTFLVYRDR